MRAFACLRSRYLTSCLIITSAVGFLSLLAPRTASVSAHANRKLEGAELFATSGCTHCHGPNGQGSDDGPNLHEVRKHLNAARIRDQITKGGKQMPAFGDALTPDQVRSLVAFLRARTWIAVPAQQPATTPAAPPAGAR